MKRTFAVWILLTAAWGLVVPAFAEDVKEIRVQNTGDGLLEEESVLAYTSLRTGDPFVAAQVSRDVKALQESDRFSDVQVKVERIAGGVAVTYAVTPRLRISRIAVEGAEYIGNKKALELLELSPGDLVDDVLLSVRSKAIRDHYAKRYFPGVDLTWDIRPRAGSGLCDVSVNVHEGRRAKVRSVRFVGNRDVKSRELRKVMKQRKSGIWSWLTNSGRLDPDQLAIDAGAVRKLYLDRGYLDAVVSDPLVVQSGQRVEITVPVNEGRRYIVDHISIAGIKLFPESDVRYGFPLESGENASMQSIQDASGFLRDYYGRKGYIETRVSYDIKTDPDGTADLAFDVREGELARARDVMIRGNTRTKDKVIRRELAILPGQVLNEVAVRASKRRLQNLGWFSYAESSLVPTMDPEYYDVVFEVEEQKTGQFMVGAGFSSIDDVVGFVEISQGNFDIFGWPNFTGGGQKAKFRAQLGTEREDIEVSFVEPWFLDRKLALGLDLYQHDRRFLSDDYDQQNVGAAVSLSPSVGRFTRLKLRYAIEDITVDNVSEDASELIRAEEGSRMKSAVTLSLTRNTLNSSFIPNRGNLSSISATLAGGPLGADTDLYELEAKTSQYVPLLFGHYLNLQGTAAVVEEYGDAESVPLFDRLFLGGARTIRGFQYRDVGPKDETGEPIGGRSAAWASAEYNVPVMKNLRLVTFYDVGMVWEEAYDFSGDLNSAWGIGMRIDITGFPLQFDYAWPIEADEWNDQPSGRFSFLIGYKL
ncbi:MAG: outer membrane protein assembly factor BamA [Kiritimatiellia bacterium]